MSTIFECVNKRLKEAEAYLKESKKSKIFLKIVRAAKINVEGQDPEDVASAVIQTDGSITIAEGLHEDLHVTISGKSGIIKDVINSGDKDLAKHAESDGNIKVESHGVKGKLFASKVRSALDL
jgi:hypothetical protein